MESLEANLEILEKILVQEFRASQQLHDLSRRERIALVRRDAALLQELIDARQQVLERLRDIYARRQQVLEALVSLNEREGPAGMLSILDPQAAYPDSMRTANPTAARLGALWSGIGTLNERIFELSQANQSIAGAELRDMESLRDFLRKQFRFQRPPGRPVPHITA